MKKKVISVTVGLVALATLAACSSSSDGDLTIVRSDLALDLSEVKDKYNLDFIYDLNNKAKRLDSTVDLDESADYYTAYVSNDIKSTAFVYSINIDSDLETLGERVQSYAIKSLLFRTSNSIYESEQAQVAAKLFDTEKGLHQYNDLFDFEINTVSSLAFTKSAKGAVKAYQAGSRDITVDVVYVPTFVVRNYGEKNMQKQKILEKVVFAPIYCQLTTGDKEIDTDGTLVDSKISSINKVTIEFDENYVATGKEVKEL